MKSSHFCLFLAIALISSNSSTAQVIDPSRIDNKVICGYQGWFNCPGDGSPLNAWIHWGSQKPRPSALTFELYPDISAYQEKDLFETGFGPLGNGERSKLFSSYPESVIQLHFQWMKDYGIDGVAVQRFISHQPEPVILANRDSVASRAARAAEDHGRIFYMMYDISGIRADLFKTITEDWENRMLAGLKITDSPAYAHQDGKPVIAIWGLGFTHTFGSAAASLDVINWFRDQGYFVIGGTPTYWRTGDRDAKPDFQEVFNAMDMISPWTVGRFRNPEEADNYSNMTLTEDANYCRQQDILYQPVLFPGFAWSNWNGGPRNEIPRMGGDFFWRQAYNIRSSGIGAAYIAMFDEYDEGTAITPAADSYFAIPTDQYFLTHAADGHYYSSDFYLRLAGDITDLFSSENSPGIHFSTSPHSAPFHFRTSLEEAIDAQPDWINTIEETTILTNTTGTNGTGLPDCSLVNDQAYQGSQCLRVQGLDQSDNSSYSYFKIFDVDILVSPETYLAYYFNPLNAGGKNVAVDLLMTDGSTLRDSEAVDKAGIDMHPGAPKGQINEWSLIESKIGDWLAGKTIDRILIAYDYGPEKRPFAALVDNIKIQEIAEPETVVSAVVDEAFNSMVRVYPNPVTLEVSSFNVEVETPEQWPDTRLKITNAQGQLMAEFEVIKKHITVDVSNWSAGIYALTFYNRGRMTTKQVVIN